MPRDKKWETLEAIGIPPYLFNVVFSIYKRVISRMDCNNDWKMDINCNIGFKQEHLSPTLFAIYIEKIEQYLEEEGCIGINMVGHVDAWNKNEVQHLKTPL